VTYPWYGRDRWSHRPRHALTIDLLVRLDRTDGPMGLAGCLFTDEGVTRGWSLCAEDGDAVFRVVTEYGAVSVRAPGVTAGRFVALTASYDGARARLYVDGTLAATAGGPRGPITFHGRTPFAVGGWWEGDRTLGFAGAVRAFAFYGAALSDDAVAGLAGTREPALAPLPEPAETDALAFVIEPTIQHVTHDAATIVWETNGAAAGEVRVGEGDHLNRVERSAAVARIHKVRLTGLTPGAACAFRVRASRPDGREIESPPAAFATMPLPGTPLRFAIVGDTQDRPEVNARVAAGMLAGDPAFALIVGDLVSAGWEKEQWTRDFFGSMRALWSRVPLFPALGNHDRNARLYYDLLALPAPYHRYAFRAGDADFFVLDTERDVGPGSEQYRWLDAALAASRARWKIVAHHYPPYSSDLDDYGTDLGDLSARRLAPLYDRHRVDVVFSGHIHSYERTHPLRGGLVADRGDGTTYVVVGGGGGDLEQFLPDAPAFSAHRRSDYHYGVVDVTADALRFTAYDLDGRPFDAFELTKEG
jgi:hypothetical protein